MISLARLVSSIASLIARNAIAGSILFRETRSGEAAQIAHDRAERLIELVRERADQLRHDAPALGKSEFLLSHAGCSFCLLAFDRAAEDPSCKLEPLY